MRRLLVLGALLGLVAFPAPASALEPPNPTVSVSSVHYAGRGVVELDLTFTCWTPTVSDFGWEPYVFVGIEQGRGRSYRSGGWYRDLTAKSCDGQPHLRVLQLTAWEDEPMFRGGSAMVYAELDACYENHRTGVWHDKYAEFWARVRVAHRG